MTASDNFSEFAGGMQRYLNYVDNATGSAMSLMARQMYINAKKNADTASNPPRRVGNTLRYGPHISGNGPGPNRGTGNLLTSMTFSSSRQGFGTYKATVGVGMIYARALELGNPRWRSGVKYPYMGPALRELITSGKISQIIAYAFRSAKG